MIKLNKENREGVYGLETGLLLKKYKENYEKIFDVFYPAKNSTGFTERNLSVNFAKAYEKINPNAITWYEFQFGEKSNLHYDAVIINPEKMELILIESKRFTNPSRKIKEIECDIARINQSISEYCTDFSSRIDNFEKYMVIGVVLCDVWTETKSKTDIRDSFQNSEFLNNYLPDLCAQEDKSFENTEYFCLDFGSLKRYESLSKNYHLLGMIWELSR